MFPNEVLIDPKDKKRLVELLEEADSILEKYPYYSDHNITCETAMSRAKTFVEDAKKWCSYLDTTDDKKQ